MRAPPRMAAVRRGHVCVPQETRPVDPFAPVPFRSNFTLAAPHVSALFSEVVAEYDANMKVGVGVGVGGAQERRPCG